MATPTTDPFKSCKLKLKRASEHNQTLYKELSAWYKSDPYRLIKEYDPETRRHVSIFELDSEKRPNLERWSLVSADCVHNLRTALDHAAYAIAAVKTGQNPPPCWDKVKFPIADADHKFREAMNRYGLSFLQESDLAMWAAIESFQPYKRPNALNARLPLSSASLETWKTGISIDFSVWLSSSCKASKLTNFNSMSERISRMSEFTPDS